MFRVMVSGSRDWPYPEEVFDALDLCVGDKEDVTIVHGACPTGADEHADFYANFEGLAVERYPADWPKNGLRAGYLRNQAMIDSAPDLVLVFVGNDSKGASMVVDLATKAGLPLIVYRRSYE